MSEDQAVYAGETPEDTQMFIRDESPHNHYSQIPNIVDDMHLSPYAYRLYGHLRRVAGENGKCWQSTTTLAAACDMSAGKISDAKRELENTYPPLIRIVSKVADGKTYHEIAVTDIWALNHQHFTGETVHHMNPSKDRSPHERDRSPHETKKNPVKNNPVIDIPPVQKIEPASTREPKPQDVVIKAMFSQGMFPNGLTGDFLATWREKHTDERIIQALQKAKGKSQQYVDTILVGWESNGYPKSRDERVQEAKRPAQQPKQSLSEFQAQLLSWANTRQEVSSGINP